jgi:hypothetical protein
MASSYLLRSHQKIALASRVVISVVLRVEVRVRFMLEGPLAALFEGARKEGIHEVGQPELHEVRRTVLNLNRSRKRQAAAHAHVVEPTLEYGSDFALAARQPHPHRVCKGDGCMVIHAPNEKEIRDYVYKVDQTCYKYTPNVVECRKP